MFKLNPTNKIFVFCVLAIGVFFLLGRIIKNYQPTTPPISVGACVWHAAETAADFEHADILLVKYQDVPVGHAYCIFYDQGKRFGWDWRGSTQVKENADAMELARELEPPIPNLVPESAQLIKVK